MHPIKIRQSNYFVDSGDRGALNLQGLVSVILLLDNCKQRTIKTPCCLLLVSHKGAVSFQLSVIKLNRAVFPVSGEGRTVLPDLFVASCKFTVSGPNNMHEVGFVLLFMVCSLCRLRFLLI